MVRCEILLVTIAISLATSSVVVDNDECGVDDASCALSLLQTRASKAQDLPEMALLMNPSSEVASSLQKQTSAFEAQVAQAQKKNEAALEAQKSSYQAQLDAQEKVNSQLAKQIKDTELEVKEATEINQDLHDQISQTENRISKIKQQLAAFQAKLGVADSLATESIGNAKLVRQGNPIPDTEKSFNEQAKELEEDQAHQPMALAEEFAAVSFLQLSESNSTDDKEKRIHFVDSDGHSDKRSAVRGLVPSNLNGLSGGLSQLRAEMAAGEQKLQDMFNAEQLKLNQTHTELEAQDAKTKELLNRINLGQTQLNDHLQRAQRSLRFLNEKHEETKTYLQSLIQQIQ